MLLEVAICKSIRMDIPDKHTCLSGDPNYKQMIMKTELLGKTVLNIISEIPFQHYTYRQTIINTTCRDATCVDICMAKGGIFYN